MRSFGFFVALALLVSVAGAKQLDQNTTGAGARAEGLGGAFIGVADDATAIVWNPAGLGQLERPEASVVIRAISDKVDYENNRNSEWNESTKQSHFNLNFGSFALPIAMGHNNLVLAVAFQRQIDLYEKEETESYLYESKGGANTVTPGLAMRFGPVFAVGAAANIWLGSNDQTEVDKTALPRSEEKTTLDFSGTNFVIGAMIDLSGLSNPVPLKFGATIRTPFDLSVKIKDVEDVEVKIQMPLMLGFGTSLRLGENFLLSADFETRAFSKKQIQFYFDGELVDEDPIAEIEKNLNQIRVGAEYLIVFGGGVIPLRAGFHTVPTTQANKEWTSLGYRPKDQAVGAGFSVGTGLITGSFALDAALSIDSYKKEYTDPAFVPELDATYKYTTGKISISGIIYF